jgi:hypothetical protein
VACRQVPASLFSPILSPSLQRGFMEGALAQLPFLPPLCLLRGSPAGALRPAACASEDAVGQRLSCGGAATRRPAASSRSSSSSVVSSSLTAACPSSLSSRSR